ncbi:MAG: DUF805 domain-containing protein [Roseicyclus sp.]
MLSQAPLLATLEDEAAAEALMLHFGSQLIAAGGVFFLVALFGYVIPQLAVTVRRLHDTGRSGWWIFRPLLAGTLAIFGVTFAASGSGGAPAAGLMALAAVIPLACNIGYFAVMCLPGDHGENRFGPDPIADRPPAEAGHPARVKEQDAELGRQLAERRREEFHDYYRARVLPAIERNRARRA